MTVNKKIIYGFLIVDIILLIIFISAIAYKRYSDFTHEPTPVKQESIENKKIDSDSDTKIRTIYFNDNVLAPTDQIDRKITTQPISKEFYEFYQYLNKMHHDGNYKRFPDAVTLGQINVKPLGSSLVCTLSKKSIKHTDDGSVIFMLEMMTDLWGDRPQGVQYIMLFKYVSDEEIYITKYTNYDAWNPTPTHEFIEKIDVDYNKNKETIERIKKFF